MAVKTSNINAESKFQITKYALEVLTSDITDEDLEMLFEDQQFSPELEEYLFLKMDYATLHYAEKNQSYVEVVQSEISKLHLLTD